MDVVIVGAGNVGRALAAGWRKAGHTVTLAVRNPGDRQAADLKKQGFHVEPVDTGQLIMSRHLEPMAMVWIKLAIVQKFGRDFGFALLRR